MTLKGQRITAEYVTQQVADILAEGGDPEAAHGDEDDLLEAIIRELAPTTDLAAAVLPLLDTERTRWYG